MNKIILAFLWIIFMGISIHAQASKGITFQGMIQADDGTYPTESNLTVRLMVMSPGNQYCVLRDEQFSNISVNNGFINLVIGSGNVVGNDPGLTFNKVFDNNSIFNSLTCYNRDGSLNATVTSYSPNSSDTRKLKLEVTFLNSGKLSAIFNLRAFPYAINSEMLNGKSDTNFIQTSANITQNNAEAWFSSSFFTDIVSGNFHSSAATNVTGIVAIANGGTGSSTAATARANLGLGTLAVQSPTGTPNGLKFLRDDWSWQTETITSVAGRTGDIVITTSDLSDFTSASDARITAQKAAVNGLATLNGSAKVPSNQLALTSSDIPNLDFSKITSGVPTTLSGYGITDDLVKNNGNVPSIQSDILANIPPAGVNGRLFVSTNTAEIYQDNGSTWIKVASVSSLNTVSGSGTISVANGSTNPVISVSTANTTTSGIVSSTDWNTFNNKLGTSSVFSGDVSGNYNSTSVDKIKGTAVTITSLTSGNFLKYNGTAWINTAISSTDLTNDSNLLKASNMPANCSASQALVFSSPTGTWTCSNIAGLDAGTITTGTIATARLPASASYWSSATGGINYASGNVGIGTSTPGATLDVNGTAKASTVVISNSSVTAEAICSTVGEISRDSSGDLFICK